MTDDKNAHGEEGERGEGGQSRHEKARPPQISSEAEEIPGQPGGKEDMQNRKKQTP